MDDTRQASIADLSATETLRELKAAQAAAWAAETRLLELAGHWADLHPVESMDTAATFTNTETGESYAEREEPIAGPGVPGVAEFCVHDLSAALGLSSCAGKKLIGHAQELRMRLPKTWARVQSGTVAPWKARQVAEATIHAPACLTRAAVRYLDGQVACRAGLIGQRAMTRLVADTILRFDLITPPECDDDGIPLVDPAERHGVWCDDTQVGFDGTMLITAHLDLADALDLEAAITAGAAGLAADGSEESLNYRRAKALGHIARTTLAGTTTDGIGRQLVLNLHLTATHGPDGLGLDPVVHLDEGQRTITIDQLRRWCHDTRTVVKIQPVIDLNTDLTAPGYRPTIPQYRQIRLRDQTCVFPWCGRPATRCDLDHVEPFDPERPAPEQTRSSNLAALCRRHHRLKTFGRWHVTTPSPGTFIWTSPHGHTYLRRPDGTTLSSDKPEEPGEDSI